MTAPGEQRADVPARRLEEYSLNASGASESLVYDGWLLGYRPGASKRRRCVNPHHASSLPVAAKIDYCAGFYRTIGLPPLFRLLPFSQPPELDGLLDRAGWARFETTLVQHLELAAMQRGAAPAHAADIVAVPEWVDLAAGLLAVDDDERRRLRERERGYPLPQAGAVVRRDGEVVACGLLKLEDDAAGLFALHTVPALRGQGIGRAIVFALLERARDHGARQAYLQVTAGNAAALTLYARFGFATVYDYWYRGLLT